MNRRLASILILLFLSLSYSFKTSVQIEDESKVAQEIKLLHLYNLNSFLQTCQELARQEQLGLSESALKDAFLRCRESFKSCEFLLMYTDNPISRQFNGPNLIVSKYNINQANNLEHPHGLQVIEALIYEPYPGSRAILKEEISRLSQLCESEIERFQLQKLPDPSKFNIFVLDAIRYELVRIEALGITGFDVPLSENAIVETSIALGTLKNYCKLYAPLLKKSKAKNIAKQTERSFFAALSYCEMQSDFDAFDRLSFIKNHLHPLSTLLKNASHALSYTFFTNVDALNREADHLFSEDALNPIFFRPINSDASIALGKKLFNETLLSIDNSRSCASCHQSNLAFTDGLIKNTAINGAEPLLRNTPSLINVAYQTRFFYDSREHTLEGQSLSVIHNELEMGVDLKSVLNELKAIPEYQTLFAAAFAKEVDENLLSQSIADYLETLASLNSRVDQYFRNQGDVLSESEKRGFNLFTGKAKCATCHFMPLFNGLLPPLYKETESEILN